MKKILVTILYLVALATPLTSLAQNDAEQEHHRRNGIVDDLPDICAGHIRHHHLH